MINVPEASETFLYRIQTGLGNSPAQKTAEVEKYRPVSLLPFLTEAFKKAVFKRVSEFLSQNDDLNPNQLRETRFVRKLTS